MGELPNGNKSVGVGSSVSETESYAAAWQRWVNKGKEQDARRRKRFYQMLWFVLPAIVLLALWSLAFRP